MSAIVVTVLQGVLLLLLYLFVARAVRWVIRDVRTAQTTAQPPRRSADAPVPGGIPGELLVRLPEGAPRVLRLSDRTEVTFGRHDSATVVLSDRYVSDFHARVWREGNTWVLGDEGSTNGTYLNRVRVAAPTPLATGDQFSIGRTTVEVRR